MVERRSWMTRLTEVLEPATDATRGEAPSRPVARRRMPLMKSRRSPQRELDPETTQACCGPLVLATDPASATDRVEPPLPPDPLCDCCPSPCVPEDTDPTRGTCDDEVGRSSRQPVVRRRAPSAERRSWRVLTTG